MNREIIDRIGKAAFFMCFGASITVSIYEGNIVPLVGMGVGSIAGPLGNIISGILVTAIYFYLKA